MELNKLKKIKTLGAGMFGTTYLVIVDNKKYALKIQHILPSHKKKDFKYELWRELDLYDYINKLNDNDKKFFTILHNYEIHDNCTHKQKRPHKLPDNKNRFAKFLKKLDNSKVCSYLLIDYHGKTSFGKYIATHNLTVKETYSFIFQLIKMIKILYKGGYSHNDLHMENIMIKKTNDKYFIFNNKKIPYYGYQLVSIDYGAVLHNKFKTKYYKTKFKQFYNNKEKWLFIETYFSIENLIINFDKYMHYCKKRNKKLPWQKKNFHPGDNIIHNIISNHNEFWIESKKEFIKNKQIERLINKIELADKPYDDVIKKNKDTDVWIIINKIISKFIALHPKLASKYYGWCSYHKINIPKDDYLQILKTNNYNQLLKFLYTKI